jgi:hypothetical protein
VHGAAVGAVAVGETHTQQLIVASVGGPGQAAGRFIQKEVNVDTTTLLLIIVIVLLLGGGGWYGRGRWY